MEENKLIEEATEAVKKNQNAGCYVEGLLAVIHRLQSEIKEYETLFDISNERKYRKMFNEEWKKEYQKDLDKQGEGVIAGFPDFDLVYKLYFEQKAKIERLTEEKKTAWRKFKEKVDECIELSMLLDKRASERAELRKQVDELKEQIKNLTSSCQSKNAKIKNLNAEKEALQNELNFQNGKLHYRYVIWNTKQNKRQFPSICELTESGAYTKLFQKIGWDSAKYRFEVRRIKIDGVEGE